jgi:Uma2 family endonuclease
MEETAEVRHEYLGGDIHALAGASKRHNRIALNFGRLLDEASRGGSSRVYISDVKVRAADEVLYYPDVVVACGLAGSSPFVEEQPCLLVEVTSPSTEIIDRREKLLVYRRIASLRAYLIVHQLSIRVDRYFRDSTGEWLHQVVEDSGIVEVPCPEATLQLDAIYERADAEV